MVAGGVPAVGPGVLVLIVGPSGSGKDALIAGARERLAGDSAFVFAERVVTRPSNAAEMHASLSESAFAAAVNAGAYALSWRAHGHGYAIPASIDDDIRGGRCVVANVSRRVVLTARERYANVSVILIDAPLDVRAERLAQRGRETSEEIKARLARLVRDFAPEEADISIVNTGTIADGTAALAAHLKTFRFAKKF